MVPRPDFRDRTSDGCGLMSGHPPQRPRAAGLNGVRLLIGSVSRASAVLVLASVTALVSLSPSAQARQTITLSDVAPQESPVALTSLPTQAQDVYWRIHAGGPFRYAKDGVVFGNRERLLPRQPRGFYREYTVPTPGGRDRGARRIVCGGKEVRVPETCFYTKDHYASFQVIDPRR